VWALPLTAVQQAMSFALQAAGHHDRAARCGLGATAISAAASVVLTASFGVTGASCAMVVRTVIVVAALSPSFRRVFPDVQADLPIGRILLCAGTLVIVCANGDRQHVWPALIGAAIGCGVYVLGLVSSGVLSIASVMRYIGPSRAITVELKS
jgi:O-antigen/teichoic acid export membrane protein